jgi:hypothetical protein
MIFGEYSQKKEEGCPESSCIESLVIWNRLAKSSDMSFPLVSFGSQLQAVSRNLRNKEIVWLINL